MTQLTQQRFFEGELNKEVNFFSYDKICAWVSIDYSAIDRK